LRRREQGNSQKAEGNRITKTPEFLWNGIHIRFPSLHLAHTSAVDRQTSRLTALREFGHMSCDNSHTVRLRDNRSPLRLSPEAACHVRVTAATGRTGSETSAAGCDMRGDGPGRFAKRWPREQPPVCSRLLPYL
jgi:hypothetical protein